MTPEKPKVLEDRQGKILKPEDLLGYFIEGYRGKTQEKIGVEFERIPLDAETGEAIPYEGSRGIAAICEGLVQTYHWRAESLGGTLYLHRQGDGVVSLEPGGQFELSTPPAPTVDEAIRLEERHAMELREIGTKLGILWCGFGLNPLSPMDRIPWVPKERYEIMRSYFTEFGGPMAHGMMKKTASIQVTIDYFSEADAALKMNIAMRISPILVACFANSCISEGRLTGAKSTRAWIWQNTDPDRCGLVPKAFREDFSFRDWVDYALEVPLFFIERGGHLIGNIHKTFRQFLEQGFGPYRATRADWELHLTCLFPEVRLRHWIEIRSIDRQSGPLAIAAPVFLKALFYSSRSRQELWSLVRKWDWKLCEEGLREAAQKAMEGRMGSWRIGDLACEIIRIADQAVQVPTAFTMQEKAAFEVLKNQIIKEGVCPADQTIRALENGRPLLELIRSHAL